MRNFNKLANLHNMFFKKSDDLSRPPVRSSNPPPEPKPNPKPVKEPEGDGWNSKTMRAGSRKVLEGRGYTQDVYNADTPFSRGVRKAVNTYGVHPDQFKGEDPTKSNMVKWIPRLQAGTAQQITPPTSYGAQPLPTGVNSQVAGALAGGTGGAVAGETGGVLGGPASSVSNGPPAGSAGGAPGGSTPTSLSDYEKYRQANPGR